MTYRVPAGLDAGRDARSANEGRKAVEFDYRGLEIVTLRLVTG
jgi:hypothetical protein